MASKDIWLARLIWLIFGCSYLSEAFRLHLSDMRPLTFGIVISSVVGLVCVWFSSAFARLISSLAGLVLSLLVSIQCMPILMAYFQDDALAIKVAIFGVAVSGKFVAIWILFSMVALLAAAFCAIQWKDSA